MSLSPSTRLGHFEVIAPIGAGGMGEVYKARDTRLDRTVAIKVLPEHLAESPERKARFEREAKAISQLNHPHICTLYDVGEQDGIDFIVMEYIEGETLAERLTKGRLKLEQALEYGIQIADGLDKAHQAGIVHRDLKPGNVMLTKLGVKLLDFGLATHDVRPVCQESDSTLSRGLTAEGVIVGTPAYMAPEQITGDVVDSRTDIFALGTVLFEAISGERPFRGNNPSELASSVLRDTPPRLSALAPGCPQLIEHLVDSCLAKDSSGRWQSAHDLARELRYAAAVREKRPSLPQQRTRLLQFMSLVLVSVLAFVLGLWSSNGNAPIDIETFTVAPPPNSSYSGRLSLSRDGTQLAIVTRDEDGTRRIWVRDLRTARTRAVAAGDFPSFSVDGSEVMFERGEKLLAVSLSSGIERLVLDGVARGTTQNQHGTLLFARSPRSALFAWGPGSSGAERVTTLDADETSHRLAQFLPDGDHFIFYSVTKNREDDGIYLGSLVAGKIAKLVSTSAGGLYAADHLLYVADENLIAQPIDLRTGTMSGEPTRIATNVGTSASSLPNVAVSNSVLVYGPNPLEAQRRRTLAWYARTGTRLGSLGETNNYIQVALSPDGSRIAATTVNELDAMDIWILDQRGVAQLVDSSPQHEAYPVWSPSGDELLFSSDRRGGPRQLYRVDFSQSEAKAELLLDSDGHAWAMDWGPDGTIWFAAGDDNDDIWTWRDGASSAFRATPYDESYSQVSPDGRWLAFASNETGRFEIYVQPLGRPGETRRISHDGGILPRWRGDGEEIFYVEPDRSIVGVSLVEAYAGRDAAAELIRSSPDVTLEGWYAVSADGERFLVIEGPQGQQTAEYTVLLDWRRRLLSSE